MFTNNLDREQLRQGDIVEGLFYPQVNCGNIKLLGSPSTNLANVDPQKTLLETNLSAVVEKKKKDGLTVFTAQIHVYCGLFAVVSQCCDLARREKEKPKASAIVVTPLLDVPYPIKQKPEQLTVLQSNTLGKFINLFHISSEKLSQDYVVDFNRVVSIPRSEYDFLVANKILQMTDKARVNFKVKLGSHFGRATDEEKASSIYPDIES